MGEVLSTKTGGHELDLKHHVKDQAWGHVLGWRQEHSGQLTYLKQQAPGSGREDDSSGLCLCAWVSTADGCGEEEGRRRGKGEEGRGRWGSQRDRVSRVGGNRTDVM